jgi:GGDEF domain-containing protein
MDMDNFKVIKNNLGHDMGDILLRNISKRLLQVMKLNQSTLSDIDRAEYFIARIASDNFMVLLANIDNLISIE